MFDCIPDKLLAQQSIISKIKDIHIIFFCYHCKKKLNSFWDNFGTLNGDWISMENEGSDLFNFVINPYKVICNDCFNSKKLL